MTESGKEAVQCSSAAGCDRESKEAVQCSSAAGCDRERKEAVQCSSVVGSDRECGKTALESGKAAVLCRRR